MLAPSLVIANCPKQQHTPKKMPLAMLNNQRGSKSGCKSPSPEDDLAPGSKRTRSSSAIDGARECWGTERSAWSSAPPLMANARRRVAALAWASETCSSDTSGSGPEEICWPGSLNLEEVAGRPRRVLQTSAPQEGRARVATVPSLSVGARLQHLEYAGLTTDPLCTESEKPAKISVNQHG